MMRCVLRTLNDATSLPLSLYCDGECRFLSHLTSSDHNHEERVNLRRNETKKEKEKGQPSPIAFTLHTVNESEKREVLQR